MTIKSKMTKKTLRQIEKIVGPLTLGKLLFSIRKADGISQIHFAQMLNITKQHLCDIEHERKSVSPQLAANYAVLLGYSEEQFIQLALQDMVDRAGLNIAVNVITKQRQKLKHLKEAHAQ